MVSSAIGPKGIGRLGLVDEDDKLAVVLVEHFENGEARGCIVEEHSV